VGDLGAEPLLEVLEAVLGVLRDIVQERGLDRDRVDAELGSDLGRGDRVGDVRLAGRPHLAGVGHDREVERVANRLEIGLGIVLRDRLDELVLERLEVRTGGRLGVRGRGRPARAAWLRSRGSRLAWRPGVVAGAGRAGLSHVRSIARGPAGAADQPPSRSLTSSVPVSTSEPFSTATLVRWIGWDGLGSRTVTVPSGVDTSSDPPGPIVSAPAAVTGPALKRMTFGAVSVALVGRTPSF